MYPVEKEVDSIPDNPGDECGILPPLKEFSKKEYSEYIERIKLWINDSLDKKVVASRRKLKSTNLTHKQLFDLICETYPQAFVFYISTKEYGVWTGASPELLLKREGSILETMALAGTRKASESVRDWDEKNIREQEIVTRSIESVLSAAGLQVETGSRQTKRAGNVEHIMTPIRATIKQDIDFISVLRQLSPTPALSGYPKSESLEIIREWEGDRVLYGGFFGLMNRNGDFRLNVMLRCAFLRELSGGNALLFAGGGITALSNPDEEWNETENKFLQLFDISEKF